jgi:hypothetical protein
MPMRLSRTHQLSGRSHQNLSHVARQVQLGSCGQRVSAVEIGHRGSDRFVRLCVPKTSSTSGDQVVFVDQASDASPSSDAVLLKIDRFG